MRTNITLAQNIIAQLLARGVRHFVICPGSFNSPFVAVLSKTSGIKIYNHFEERGAAFFALGLCKQLGLPVVVCVTSGTAVAECLPAVIEAYYVLKGLVVLSADREAKLSGTGYPQSINQAGLLSSHTVSNIDVTKVSDLAELPEEIRGPVHCNVRFKEPILEAGFEITEVFSTESLELRKVEEKCAKRDSLSKFLENIKRPLVIVDDIPKEFSAQIRNLLLSIGAPILAEARSGLRENSEINHLVLKSQDILLARAEFDCVLRIGSVPTSDIWRALERDQNLINIPVCSLTKAASFPGLSRATLLCSLEEEEFSTSYTIKDQEWASALFEKDLKIFSLIQSLLKEFPQSEPALVSWLSKQIPCEASIYLGNSLPIREWNEFADREDRRLAVDANRGANGIDGQIASFFGASIAANKKDNWALIGDLTFLYDCNSLGLLKTIPELNFCLAVIQNNGGKIFEKLPYFGSLIDTEKERNSFLNKQTVNCLQIAQAFGIEGIKINKPILALDLPRQVVLEINPNEQETLQFWQKHAQLFRH